MASKRDLYQSYQFGVQRVISGLVMRETDPPQTPLRRMGGAMFGSVMIAVIALAIAGIIGVIKGGGNTSWKDGGAVILDEDSGAIYAWLQNPETKQFALHPITNFPSAALIVGSPTTIEVSPESLADAPRGVRLGMVDVPNSLPKRENFDTGPWTLCTQPAKTVSNTEVPVTSLSVGQSRTSGRSIEDSSIILHDIQTDTYHLVWNGHRFALPNPDAAATGLGLRDAPKIQVGTAMLTSLPEGPAIAPLHPQGSGTPSSAMPQYRTGQVLVDDTTEQYYLVEASTVRNISEVDAIVTLSDPATASAYAGASIEAIEVKNADVIAADPTALPKPQFNDPPRDIPQPADVAANTSTVCASFVSGSSQIDIAVEAMVEGDDAAIATPQRTENGTVLADAVLVKGGHGVLVRSVQSTNATEGALYLVSDNGKRYAIPNEEARGALGLADVVPVEMPASLVARIPEGAALDPVSAMVPS